VFDLDFTPPSHGAPREQIAWSPAIEEKSPRRAQLALMTPAADGRQARQTEPVGAR
jgi:hypothetical protein